MARNTQHRKVIWLRDPDEGGGGGGIDQQQQKAEFKPPASQEEFDRIIQDRVKRAEAKYADYEAHKAKSAQWDALSAESQTEHERAVAEARQAGFVEGQNTFAPKAVKAEFKAAAKGVLSAEQVTSLLEDLDLSKYAKDDGDPDEEKIAKKIAAFAPGNGGGGRNGTGRPPVFGQGAGHEGSAPRKGEAGLAEAQRRFGKSASS